MQHAGQVTRNLQGFLSSLTLSSKLSLLTLLTNTRKRNFTKIVGRAYSTKPTCAINPLVCRSPISSSIHLPTPSTCPSTTDSVTRRLYTTYRHMSSDTEQIGNKLGVTAAAQREAAKNTIFGKIVRGEIPAKKIYEDDIALAFHDVNPQAPVHFLVIPKEPITGLSDVQESDKTVLGHMMYIASKVAAQLGLPTNGYRLVINDGVHGQQSVNWIHIHILGGRQMSWPPG